MRIVNRTNWDNASPVTKEETESWIEKVINPEDDKPWAKKVGLVQSGDTLVVRINDDVYVCKVTELITIGE